MRSYWWLGVAAALFILAIFSIILTNRADSPASISMEAQVTMAPASTSQPEMIGIGHLRFPAAPWSYHDLKPLLTEDGIVLVSVLTSTADTRLTIYCQRDFAPRIEQPLPGRINSDVVMVAGEIVRFGELSDASGTYWTDPFRAGEFRCLIEGRNVTDESIFRYFLDGLAVDTSTVLLPEEGIATAIAPTPYTPLPPTLTPTPEPPNALTLNQISFPPADWVEDWLFSEYEFGVYDREVIGSWHNEAGQAITIRCWNIASLYPYAPPYGDYLITADETEAEIDGQAVRLREVTLRDPAEIFEDVTFFLVGPFVTGEHRCVIEAHGMAADEVEAFLGTVEIEG